MRVLYFKRTNSNCSVKQTKLFKSNYFSSSKTIKITALFLLLFLATLNSYSQNANVIVGWNYGNGKVLYCGMGYMMNPASYNGDFFQHNAEKRLFVNMVRKVSNVANPVVGIFASGVNSNQADADTLIAVLARDGITGVVVTSAMIDTPAEIDNYDVLILGGSGLNTSEAAVGYHNVQSVVRDFAYNNHGGVIFAGWMVYTIYYYPSNNSLSLPDYADMMPVNTSSSYTYTSGYTLYKNLPNDPLFNGVGIISCTGTCESPGGGAKPGTTVYAGNTTYNAPTTPPSNPTSITVSVNPINSGSGTLLTANGAVGTVYWYKGGCGDTLVTSGNPVTVFPTTTTTYYALNYDNSQFSNACASATVTVNTILAADISGGITPICYNTSPGTFTANGIGGEGNYYYLWYKDGISTGITSQTYVPGNLTSSATFYCAITSGSFGTVNSDTTTIIVYNNFTSGTIATTGQSICYNDDPSLIGNLSVASGGNDTITYVWYKSITNFVDSTLINSNTASYDPPTGLTQTTSYRRYAKDSKCNTSFVVSAGTWVVTVNPLPTASISGTTSVCKDGIAPNVTFTGANGTAPYTFTYKINTGSNQTVSTTSGNSVTVSAPTSAVGTFTYTLISVQDASSTTCSQNQTGSAVITVNPLPTATISGTTAVCKDVAAPDITFTGANGTAPYTFTYKINTGSTQTVATTSGNSVTVSVPTSTAGTFTYTLLSVQDASSTACIQSQTGNAEVTVNPLPTATISGTTAVCKDATAPIVTFTGANGTAPYTFTYKLNNSSDQTITTTSGNSVTLAAPTSLVGTYTYTLESVQDASSTTCSQNQTGSAVITVNVLPTPTISGPTSLCNFTTGNVYTTEAGKSNYVWNVPGGTITAGAGTNTITVTWNIDGAQTVSVNYANSFGCIAPTATVYNVNVKAGVNPSITGSPSNAYVVHALDTIHYCTPYVYGHLYSWSGFGQISYSSEIQHNCITDYLCNPCGVYGAWAISVTETNPVTGCTATATKDIYIQTP